MTRVERRQTERKLLEKHAYINIEPNNVGMVLNVSAGGLCFHSVDPVKQNGPVRFGLSGQKQRIEAEGVLVWSDETNTAGLRFTSLSAVARDRVRSWLSESTTSSTPMAQGAPNSHGPRPEADNPAYLSIHSPGRGPRLQLSGFSRGLATGLLLSLFVAAGFLFHGYRHEFGEWLIRTGERFAAKSQSQPLTVAASAEPDSRAPQSTPDVASVVAPARKVVPLLVQKVVPSPKTDSMVRYSAPALPEKKLEAQPEQTRNQSPADPVTPQPAKLSSVEPTGAVKPDPVTNSATAVHPVAVAAPSVLQPSTASASAAPVVLASTSPKLEAAAKEPSVSTPSIHTEESKTASGPSSLEVFFEVGKFKNPLLAHNEADKVTRLGLPAMAVHKHFLWASSYQVLVGPFSEEQQAKTTHDTLVSNGFKPQTFEKGSRSLILASTVSTDGGSAPEGEYVISWESYIGNASVKFLRNNSLVATANAKWIERGVKYRVDSYVYRRNPDGSRTLLEIHFGGMRQALVFGRSS